MQRIIKHLSFSYQDIQQANAEAEAEDRIWKAEEEAKVYLKRESS